MAEKVCIDQDECIGCENCVEIWPGVFSFNAGSGKAEVIDDADGDAECVDEAIASCPVNRISRE